MLAAGTRFFSAGLLLYAFMRFRGEPAPTPPEWRNLAIVGLLLFVAVYAPLFWAEKYVPSGLTSVIGATLPLMTLIIEMLVLRQQPFRWSLLLFALLGFAGVLILVLPGSQQSAPLVPCLAILGGSAAWSFGSVLSRSLQLPASKVVLSGGAMLVGGSILLVLSAALGELSPLPHVSLRGWMAVLYLTVVGSLLAFTAFIWLLARMPAARVASYAYVNPVVALALGYLIAGESISFRVLAGAAIVLLSVVLTLRARS